MTETTKAPSEYSEQEAALTLGITVDELRRLVQEHIVQDTAAAGSQISTYRASDVLVLRVLAQAGRCLKAAGA